MSVRTTTPSDPGSARVTSRLSELRYDEGVIRLLRVFSVGGLVLALLSTLGSLAVRAAAPLSDPDTWWHLVMGQRFLDGTSIRHPGAMSHYGTEDWRPRDWLSQLTMAQFEDWFGLPGVAWLYGLGLVVFALVLFRICRRRTTFGPAALATTIGVMAATASLSARPQLVSFILLAVTVDAVLRTGDDLRPRWWLALLTGLWACLHGMWFLSPVLQGVLLLGLLMDRRLDRGLAVRLSGLVLLSLAAVAVTPNGIALLSHPLGSSLEIAQYIQEYEPPSIGSLYYTLTLLMIGGTLLLWVLRKRPSWLHLLVLLLAAAFAIQMLRTVAIGAVLVTPLFAAALDDWLSGLDLRIPAVVERVVVYVGAVAALVGLGLSVSSTADHAGNAMPVAFDAQVDRIPASAVLYNELGDGGYLTWRHPDLSLVEDGLSDQYPTSWHLDYFRANLLEPGWEKFVERTRATYALLSEKTPLATALQLEGWQVIARDDDRLLLQAPR